MSKLFAIILIPSILLILCTHQSPLVGVQVPFVGIERAASSEAFVGVGVMDDVPQTIKKRKVVTPSPSLDSASDDDDHEMRSYCRDNKETYNKYCDDMWTDRPANIQTALFQFCPAYENKCVRSH